MHKKLFAKVGLENKYARLAKVAKSEKKRKKFVSKINKYRRQSKDLIQQIINSPDGEAFINAVIEEAIRRHNCGDFLCTISTMLKNPAPHQDKSELQLSK